MLHILKVVNQTIKLEIKINIELVTSVKQVIKNILRKVMDKFRIRLKHGKNKQFCLKVKGFEDYLYGCNQIMNYHRTRSILRGFTSMQLTLIEIDKQTTNLCPYLFTHQVEWALL